MKWKERYLLDYQKKYSSLAVFGTKYNAEYLVEYFGEIFIKKYIEVFLLSKKLDNTKFFHEVPIKTVMESRFSKDGLIIIASDVLIKDEIKKICNDCGYSNTIHITDFLYDINEDRIQKYIDGFNENKFLFKDIEIETVNRCNGSCGFCPVNKNEKQRPYHKMSEKLFYSIIDQLADLNYDKQIALFSNNEPFLDDRIVTFAEYTRKKLPKAWTTLCTNGKLLTEAKYREIFPFIDYLLIDIYTTEENREIPENINRILEIAKEEGWDKQTNISVIEENAIRTSRTGTSPNSKVNTTIDNMCILPWVQMTVRPDGKISLCCSDALGQVTLGDLKKESLLEVWYGDTYNKVREKIFAGRENMSLCKYCNFIQDIRWIFVEGTEL